MSAHDQKVQLRKLLRSRLKGQIKAEDSDLRDQLKHFLADQTGTWGAFSPLPGEPDLRPLIHEVPHLTWVFPRIEGHALEFHELGPIPLWVEGPFGILEPAKETPRVSVDQIQGLLIPGLGFDPKGGRLGRGKGFYDRLLKHWGGLRVGVCFELQKVEQIPTEPFDQHVDWIVTETGPHRAQAK